MGTVPTQRHTAEGTSVGKRSGKRRGDARLRVVRNHDAAPGKRGTTQPGDAMQPLVVELRRRMRSTDPWELLAFVSTIVSVSDASEHDQASAALAGLVESFVGVDLAETTAALKVLSVLVADADLGASIRAELAHRTQPMPLWLRGIDETRVSGAAIMTEGTATGDDVILGIDWAGGGRGSFLTYIDHASGTVVKDAFPSPMSLDETVDRMRTMAAAEDDVEVDEIDLDEARGLIEDALLTGDATGTEFQSDTWPSGRPILEWLLRTMPEPVGVARGTEGMALAAEAISARVGVIEDFVRSADAEAIGLELTEEGEDDYALTLVAGSDAFLSVDEFLDWTPERIERLLLLSFPVTALVDEGIARRLPEVLGAFAVWSLRHHDAPEKVVAAVRRAVEKAGPEYVAIATSREAELLRYAIENYAHRVGTSQVAMPILEAHRDIDWEEWLLEYRGREVGGVEALMKLDVTPLPDEAFDWSVVPEDIVDVVREIVTLVDDFADRTFGVEYRTACRRFLAAVVAADAAIFRRRASTAGSAAVVAWLVGRSNGLVGQGGGGMLAGELWSQFGVKGASSRADAFRNAVGVDTYELRDALGRPEWLVSDRRKELVRVRDEAVQRRG